MDPRARLEAAGYSTAEQAIRATHKAYAEGLAFAWNREHPRRGRVVPTFAEPIWPQEDFGDVIFTSIVTLEDGKAVDRVFGCVIGLAEAGILLQQLSFTPSRASGYQQKPSEPDGGDEHAGGDAQASPPPGR